MVLFEIIIILYGELNR